MTSRAWKSAVGTIHGIITAARPGLLKRIRVFRHGQSPAQRRLKETVTMRKSGCFLRSWWKIAIAEEVDKIPESDEITMDTNDTVR